MTDYGNPRLRATTDNESAYVNALMAVGHQALTDAFSRTGTSAYTMEITVDVDPADYGVSTAYGSTVQTHLTPAGFWSRTDDLTGVVFDSLFSRFRAQAIYGSLEVTFTGATGVSQSRDTY